jgi:hypothetical protein
LSSSIRAVALDLNTQLKAMNDRQNEISEIKDGTLIINGLSPQALRNLRACVKLAASVVSSSSTHHNVDMDQDRIKMADSNFGDVFPESSGLLIHDWINANEFPDSEDPKQPSSFLDHKWNNLRTLLGPYVEWESDETLEMEFVQTLFNQATSNINADRLVDAETDF